MKSQNQLVNVVDSHSKWLRSRWQRSNLVLALATSWFMLLPITQAVEPPPDGGYANFNTAEGGDALFSLTSGAGNTALGDEALYNLTTGSDNTGVGYNALLRLTTSSFNTAVGASALFNSTTGSSNTATGYDALGLDTTGSYNTATGISGPGKKYQRQLQHRHGLLCS